MNGSLLLQQILNRLAIIGLIFAILLSIAMILGFMAVTFVPPLMKLVPAAVTKMFSVSRLRRK